MINTVNKHQVSDLFNPDTDLIFEIPKYQREYTWATWQWEDLFDDLTENDKGYFLGSIICINTTDSINAQKREVIDGQQRLTTLSIFFAAIYDALDKQKEYLDGDQRFYLQQLKRRFYLKGADDKIRVIPQTQNNNLNDYKSLLSELKIIPHKNKPNNAGNRRIYKSYYYFKKRIDKNLEEFDNKVDALFDILDKINSAIIVMINVSSYADAYTLFESLNNRGTPLTAIDLIKNLLLARLDLTNSGNIDFYFEQWTQILNYIGDDYSVQERFFRHNYNAFRKIMNAPFRKDDRIYPLGIIATRTNLLSIYEKVITADPKVFIEGILENASIYSTILCNQEDVDNDIRESYIDLKQIQGTPSYLLLLYILKNTNTLQVNNKIVFKINKLMTNFFVRRNLTDIPSTRDLTRIFMFLVEEIEEKKYVGDELYKTIRNKLIECSASDNIFEERLTGQIYVDNSEATRFILCALAQKGMTSENKKDLWKYNNSKQYVWTIEHIFPQGENIPPSWIDMIADGNIATAKEYQSLYVHTLGNLTLTGYNSTLSNRSFEDKKNRIDNNGNFVGYRNGLNLNSDVVSEDKWSIEIIKKRTEKMVKEIMELFKL